MTETERLRRDLLQAVLLDRLDYALPLAHQDLESYGLLADLIARCRDKELPLQEFTANLPDFFALGVSYTCGLGCKMCNAGFADRTDLFEDYKALSPEEFEAIKPWMESSRHVALVGLGETLESPHVADHLKQLEGKVTYVSTSGVPLNRDKIVQLIEANLQYLVFSFEGETSSGHGADNTRFIQKFWEKVQLVEKVKRELGAEHPRTVMTIALSAENIDQLEDLITTSIDHGIQFFHLLYLVPERADLHAQSVFKNFPEYRARINAILDRFADQDVTFNFYEQPRAPSGSEGCFYIDKFLFFDWKYPTANVCCGPLNLPLEKDGVSPNAYWNSFPLRYLRYLFFYPDASEQPKVCERCWVMDCAGYSDFLEKKFGDGKTAPDIIPQYQAISALKGARQWDSAYRAFQELLGKTYDGELQSKIHFHLGEIELHQGNEERALTHMEQSVSQDFAHRSAFAYLSLLLRLQPKTINPLRIRTPNLDFLDYMADQAPMNQLLKSR